MKSIVTTALNGMMWVAVALLTIIGVSHSLSAAEGQTLAPNIGQVRTLALSPTNRDVVTELHHEGWLEARGQLLNTEEFPELYRVVGRTWTGEGAPTSRFAIPNIQDRSQTQSADNPYGVLGPGDLVSSGRRPNWARSNPLTYWIFVGTDVSNLSAVGGR